ncbi:GNAT family N-acetyltransferase [Chromobacterium sp. IIBBL 290-4]|uniref:GNAT family N-acetyltransferase n=1 Tax=Chromobacterium sp. IIBBL 290-4 TaxID=2953890 RepID=UPI0020B88291|nr:GNAT family N-acetyltransferase [Chromobacterium sp. IIBBL 290-4]UTH76631.1 hypothetical protein NKT35_11240 [Chromobacterium sp. IIBBL 290-4]
MMMEDKPLTAWHGRPASREEWRMAMRWAEAEGWDLGLGDADCFFDADPHGFYLGFAEGRAVASASAVNLDAGYCHIGHYLADPACRGKGWARQTWALAMRHAGDRTAGCDGMPAQIGNYQKWGMEAQYRTLRLSGVPIALPQAEPELESVTAAVLESVAAYDRQCGGVQRHALLRRWFLGEGRRGWLSRAADGRINGLLGLRASSAGYRLGPFYADEDGVRQKLFRQALACLPPGAMLTLDAPETAGELIREAQERGLREIFHTYRMYRGAAPQARMDRIHAIASLELG